MSAKLLHDLDGTKLHKIFTRPMFDTIIFQFPHSGSREPINNLNPNYVLMRNFIISASRVLKKDGIILVTIVDNDFYNNMFRLEELATDLGLTQSLPAGRW